MVLLLISQQGFFHIMNLVMIDWTAKYRPWKIIYTKEFEMKKEAVAHEKWLKNGVGREFIKSLPHS
jgi:predicted GIY-YIG superfamily endonuclease